jgi:tetratricopeptide (TPR) repeat protein
VDAKLRHRKHSLEFQTFACESSRSERALRFATGAVARGKVALDPCAEQPVTEIGAATVWMGRNASSHAALGGAARPLIERLLTQGLALLHAKQEHVHVAKPSIERALRLSEEEDPPLLRARALVLRARLAAIQGRPREAVAFTARAEALVGPHPVLDRLRGDAFARVWRWKQAAAAYQRVAEASPGDPRAWRNLARAYGSLTNDEKALAAADAGLRLAPHDTGLLRSRALALQSMGHPDAERAKREWLSHRAPDAQAQLLASCEQAHQRCRKDRQPIPHYTLAHPTKHFHASVDPI